MFEGLAGRQAGDFGVVVVLADVAEDQGAGVRELWCLTPISSQRRMAGSTMLLF